MKTYTMSFAASTAHTPDHPDRTAKKASGAWDVRYQVWPSRAAMARSIRMQQSRAPRSDDWLACVPLTDTEGY